MRTNCISIGLLVLACCLSPGPAAWSQDTTAEQPARYSDRGFGWGPALQWSIPASDFDDRYNSGPGIQVIADYPMIPLLTLVGSVGWNHFAGANDGDGADIWEFNMGVNFELGAFYIGGEVGYFTNVDETSYVPSLGLRFTNWAFAWRVKAASGHSWHGPRVGYYF